MGIDDVMRKAGDALGGIDFAKVRSSLEQAEEGLSGLMGVTGKDLEGKSKAMGMIDKTIKALDTVKELRGAKAGPAKEAAESAEEVQGELSDLKKDVEAGTAGNEASFKMRVKDIADKYKDRVKSLAGVGEFLK